MSRYQQGIYKPENPDKYKGNVNNIVYRSSWELQVLRWFDTHPDVIEYSSEEFIIPYISPLDNRYHRYFVDFYVKYKDATGVIRNMIIEVKPASQTVQPKKTPKKKMKTFLREVATYAVNEAKWTAARKYAAKKGWEFKIITEKDLIT